MIKYTVTSGTPTQEELQALEIALARHKKIESEADDLKVVQRSKWAKPNLRTPLERNS